MQSALKKLPARVCAAVAYTWIVAVTALQEHHFFGSFLYDASLPFRSFILGSEHFSSACSLDNKRQGLHSTWSERDG